MEDDLEIQSFVKTEPKKGRRAKVLLKGSNESGGEDINNTKKINDTFRPSRRQMGWDKNSNTYSSEPIDARLIQDSNPKNDDDDDDDVETHSIPDLAEIHEDTLIQEIAAPPSLFTSNIASYKLVFYI